LVAEYTAMEGQAIVAATDATFTMAPPLLAGPARPHRAERVLDAQRGADDVYVQHATGLDRVEVDDQAGDLDPGIVDQDVEAAERVDGVGDRVFPGGLLGDIEGDELRGGPGLPQALHGGLAQVVAVTAQRCAPGVTQDDRTCSVAEVVESKQERISRRLVDKFGERRAQIAAAALHTLADLGYAQTSLRDIANNSEFSHGVLHYYFRDKVDLLTQAVHQYEAVCVTRYDAIVASAASADELSGGFGDEMAATLQADARLHRLWYDLRNQSLFEESFRDDVFQIDQRRQEMVWNVVSRYAELAGAEVAVSPDVAYAMFDGLFQQALLRQLASQDGAGALRADVARLLERLIVKG
jgi:AcrR family transcriptional regulator